MINTTCFLVHCNHLHLRLFLPADPALLLFSLGAYSSLCLSHALCYCSLQLVFVMPSSSARCAQLPRAEDKLPFFVALRKLRDFVRGELPELRDQDVVFADYTEFRVTQPDPKSLRKAERRRKRKAEAAAAAALAAAVVEGGGNSATHTATGIPTTADGAILVNGTGAAGSAGLVLPSNTMALVEGFTNNGPVTVLGVNGVSAATAGNNMLDHKGIVLPKPKSKRFGNDAYDGRVNVTSSVRMDTHLPNFRCCVF